MGPDAEFKDFDSSGSWALVYHTLRQTALQNHDFSLKDARKPDFRGRNRYRDVSPYDHSRVQLERDNIDYINASLVLCEEANRQYILTQGPLADTSGHFWLMVWEQQSAAILMLNRVIEKGMVKCHQYFPMGAENEDTDQLDFDDVGLSVQYISQEDASYYTVRTLEIIDHESGESRRVLQFHYTTWPDFGVPQSPGAFLNFLMAVRESGALDHSVGPPVIHCSAGIGRSGTFCLVDSSLILIEKNNNPNCVDVRELLLDMRKYRMGLIQTHDQLRFSYMAIIEGSKRVLSPSPDSGFEDREVHIFQSQDNDEDEGYQNGVQAGGADIDDDMDDSDDSPPETPPPLPPRRALDGATLYNPRPPISPHMNTPSGEDHSPVDDVINSYSEEYVDTAGLLAERSQEEAAMEKLKNDGVEIRRRNREERKKKTEDLVKNMKKKQREHEEWQTRRQHVQPYMLGLSVAVLIGGILLYRYYFT